MRNACFFCLVGAVLIISVCPSIASGSNTTSPAPVPVTPAPLVTSQPQAALLGDASCAQQLNTIGIVANGVALGTQLLGTTAEGVAAAAEVGPAEAAAIATQVVGITAQSVAYANMIQATALPSCEQQFTGTVTVSGGGVNVSGVSIFNNNVGVNGDVNVSGNVNASQVHATQGISADGGAIWIGDPNGTTYSSGITLGGGALSGAGTGGPQAFTGDVSAVAIGNGASAFNVNSVALGTNARAGNSAGTGTNATAVGANSSAPFANSAAFGANATTTRANQIVLGTANNTYTMAGLVSPNARQAQSGLLQLPTTDAFGNLASDGGETFKAVARLQASVAVSLALAPPVLANGERFGIRVGWGGVRHANAMGISAAGLLASNMFSKHDRLVFDGGIGIGYSQFMGYSQNAIAGARAGLQLTW